MAKKKKQPKHTSDSAVLKNSIYAVKGARKTVNKKAAMLQNVAATSASLKAMEKGKKIALIEAYAKEHGVSIAQAMIHFM